MLNDIVKSKKSQATFIMQMITAFFAIGVIAFIYFFFYGKYFDIHAIVESNEMERHTINMAQILSSSKKLVYSESIGGEERFYRGVFDKSKLDNEFIPEEEYKTGIIERESGVKEDITYPNSVTRLTIKNLDNDDVWLLASADYSMGESSGFMNCLALNIGLGFTQDYEECRRTYLASKTGTFEKNFPLLIKDGDSLHPARLTFVLTEKESALALQNI